MALEPRHDFRRGNSLRGFRASRSSSSAASTASNADSTRDRSFVSATSAAKSMASSLPKDACDQAPMAMLLVGLDDGTVRCRRAPDSAYAASIAASRSITIGHPARMPSNAVLPAGVSRSKPACSSDSRVPSPSGVRDQVMTVFSTPGANA